MSNGNKRSNRTRREMFEEQLKSLQNDISSLSSRMSTPAVNITPSGKIEIKQNPILVSKDGSFLYLSIYIHN